MNRNGEKTYNPEDIVFEVKNLTKTYRMGEVEVHALRGTDLELFPGELVVFLGPSGSGKSTLLNILGGLDTATSGFVSYRGKDLTDANEQELTEYRRYHVGFVFQFYNLIPSLTARENVAVVTEIARNPMTPEEALAVVGLTERLDHFPAQLSGGEQQRVAIARALANNPPIILADEPTGNLDSTSAVELHKLFFRLRDTFKQTYLIVTHNLELADMADRKLTMKDGLFDH